ncbi:hypothetical protein AAC387_Pa01g1236 [Persea americana]
MEVVRCRCPENSMKKPSRSFPSLKSGTKMTVSGFSDWLQHMDRNDDGIISKPELQKAVKSLGVWFTNWKAKKAMAAADFNDNTVIDTDEELQQLIMYAQKHWGLTISED